MNISGAASRTGLTSKMIRYYEHIGLLLNISRTISGYRTYSEEDVQVLLFIKRTRDLGFSMAEVKALLMLWQNKDRSSAEVKKLTEQHISDLEHKALNLQAMANFLRDLAQGCHGDEHPDCPIIDALAKNEITN